jgi:mono/diheme cytochrome c family protein
MLLALADNVLLQTFGHAHPALLHMPFGLFLALLLIEFLAVWRKQPPAGPTRSLLVALLVVSSVVAAGSGWFLGQESDYGGDTLETHKKLGIAVAVASLLLGLCAWRSWRTLYGASLGAGFVLLLVAGHYGGSMTHGEGFLLEPWRASRDAADTLAAPMVYPVQAAPDGLPILDQRCTKCHGTGRQRGGLALHDRASLLAGGESGPAVVKGDPYASELMRRLRLPLDDEDHMPPDDKPQLTPEEIETIAEWIAAGLPTATAKAATRPVPGASQAPAVAFADVLPVATITASVPAADADAVARWRAEQVHVEPVDPQSGLLWVDFRAFGEAGDEDVLELIATLGPSLGELSLASADLGDDALTTFDEAPSLVRLDLSDTSVTAPGLAALSDNMQLEVLDLTGTAVDDTGVPALAAIPSLRRVYLWDSDMTAAGVARLRELRPALDVIDGTDVLSDALEIEPELVLSEPPSAVNSICPVSGDDVDSQFILEHDGTWVGFCCANCPATFLADPDAYPVTHAGPRLGNGAHRYEWEPDWLQLPESQAELGNTHGEIVVDRAGNLHLNTDTEQAIMVFAPDGRFLRSWGAEFANGLHGMQLVEEDGAEYLYFTHFNRHEFGRATLAGEIVWRMGYPEESGKYENANQFRPTSIAVAPDGGFFVTDGYGENWVHQYDADRSWLRSIGGPGTEPGKFRTPHGVWVDTRSAEPVLVVADRENNRLQRFDMQGEWLGVVEGMLRRPCKIQQRGEYLVIPDLAGRVTILDGNDELVAQLGDNPDPGLRANNGVDRELWMDGEFLAPHSAVWDRDGNLYVMDWNRHGRITKLRHLPR